MLLWQPFGPAPATRGPAPNLTRLRPGAPRAPARRAHRRRRPGPGGRLSSGGRASAPGGTRWPAARGPTAGSELPAPPAPSAGRQGQTAPPAPGTVNHSRRGQLDGPRARGPMQRSPCETATGPELTPHGPSSRARGTVSAAKLIPGSQGRGPRAHELRGLLWQPSGPAPATTATGLNLTRLRG